MELKYRLLDHPFYKSWSDGKITKTQLSKYSSSYLELIEKIPLYWKKVIDEFVPDSTEGMTVITEEISHIPMWQGWSSKLDNSENFPKMDDLFLQFGSMNASELLGALHSFEIQQPEVAQTKKQGLLNFYGFTEKDLIYFDEHIAEDNHIQFGKNLAEMYANKEDFSNGFHLGSELFYKALDKFVEC
jgi:pyrroloquinoline-quinone synthase